MITMAAGDYDYWLDSGRELELALATCWARLDRRSRLDI